MVPNAQRWRVDFSPDHARAADFVGREDLFSVLAEWVFAGAPPTGVVEGRADSPATDAAAQRGWGLITGAPGLGKTAAAVAFTRYLGAEAVRRETRVFPVLHLIRKSTDELHRASRIRRSLIATLEEAFPTLIADGDDDSLGPALARASTAVRDHGPGARVVLLIDGLDEAWAEGSLDPLPLFLEPTLPPQVVGLCFSRPTPAALEWFAGLPGSPPGPRVDLDSAEWRRSNAVTVEAFWQRHGQGRPFGALSPGERQAVLTISAGNMLVATRLESSLRLAFEHRKQLINLHALVVGGANPLMTLVQREVTGPWLQPAAVLAALRDPISDARFAALLGWSPAKTAEFRRALPSVLDAGDGLIGQVHPLLRETVAHHVGRRAMTEAHARLAQRLARTPSPGNEFEPYALRNLVYHRVLGAQLREAWRLLRRLDVLEERLRAVGSPVVEEDLELFIRHSGASTHDRELAGALRRVLVASSFHGERATRSLAGLIFNGLVASGFSEESIRREWYAPDGWPAIRLECQLLPSQGWLRSAQDPSGARVTACAIATEGALVYTGHSSGRVRIWSADLAAVTSQFASHEAAVLRCVLSPDERILATASSDGEVRLWDAAVLGSLKVKRVEAGVAVYDLAFAADGVLLCVLASGRVIRWAYASDELTEVWRADDDRQVPRACALSSDGSRLLLCLESRQGIVLDLATGQVQARLVGHGSVVRAGAWLQEREEWVTGSWDGTVRTWDRAGNARRTLAAREGVRVIGLAAVEGTSVVFVCDDGTLSLWSGEAAGPRVTVQAHQGKATACTWAPVARRVATSGADGRITLWALDAIRVGGGAGGPVCQSALDMERRVAVVATDDGTVQAYDVGGERRGWTRVFTGASLSVLSLSPAGEWLAVGVGADLAVIHARDGRDAARLAGHTERVRCVLWTRGGLVSGSDDGTLLTWSRRRVWERGTVVAVDRGRILTIAGDDDAVYFGTSSGNVGRYDTAAGHIETIGAHDSPVRSIRVGSEGIWTLASDGSVGFARLEGRKVGSLDLRTLPECEPVGALWRGSQLLVADAACRVDLWPISPEGPLPSRPRATVLLTSRPLSLALPVGGERDERGESGPILVGEEDGNTSFVSWRLAEVSPRSVTVVLLCDPETLEQAEALERLLQLAVSPLVDLSLHSRPDESLKLPKNAVVACLASAALCDSGCRSWSALRAAADRGALRAVLVAEVGDEVDRSAMPPSASVISRRPASADDHDGRATIRALSTRVLEVLRSLGPSVLTEGLRELDPEAMPRETLKAEASDDPHSPLLVDPYEGPRLSGAELGRLLDAIVSAFPTRALLALAARRALNVGLAEDPQMIDNRIVASELFSRAEPRGEGRAFVARLLLARPDSTELASVAQELGVAPRTSLDGPERAVNRLGFSDMAGFTARMTAVQHRVGLVLAKVGVDEQPLGTCLLVGPDLVLTNCHVLADAIRHGLGGVAVRFDHFSQSSGVVVPLARDAVVDSLDHAPFEVERSDDPDVVPGDEQLDYALLRLAENASQQHPNGAHEITRGFELLDPEGPLPTVGVGLIIVQHPEGRPMRVAIEGNGAVTSLRGDVRVRYRVNTLGGSSGSPCFDHHWRLLALHHYGGPVREGASDLSAWNQGVPIRTIARRLRERGHLPR